MFAERPNILSHSVRIYEAMGCRICLFGYDSGYFYGRGADARRETSGDDPANQIYQGERYNIVRYKDGPKLRYRRSY
jgi:hypothetical protein